MFPRLEPRSFRLRSGWPSGKRCGCGPTSASGSIRRTIGTLAGDCSALPLIAVDFPVFSDGRGYSAARLLRERYGFQGELRAIGDVLRDQLYYLAHCGFNAFAVRADRDIEDAFRGLSDFSDNYQATWARPAPLFRRRTAESSQTSR